MKRRTRLLVIVVASLAHACASVSRQTPPVGGSVVLDPSVAAGVLDQCSRATPNHVTGFWYPAAADARRLDEDLGKLSKLSSSLCCLEGAHVRRPESYYRQYMGVVVGAERFIYINALGTEERDWLQSPVAVCDGGDGYWGALYNVRTRSFSEVAFNGSA